MSQFFSFWPIFIIVILSLVAFILHTSITFTIRFTQVNSYSKVQISAQALNKLVNMGLKVLYQTKVNESDDEFLINDQSKSNPIFSMPTISESIEVFHRFKKKHLRRMRCETLSWETQVGVNDPMASAMLAGSLWGVKYFLLGKLSAKFMYKERPIVKIHPLYHHTHFNTELNCVLKIKFKQALYISILLVWHLAKSRRKKEKLKRKAANLMLNHR